MLTREEEHAAATSGDIDTLVMSQMPWVIRIAQQISTKYRYEDIESLISAGTVGLTRAVRKFDPDVGCRLTTFVTRPIFWACHREVMRTQTRCSPRNSKGQFIPTELWGDEPPPIADRSDCGLEPDTLDILNEVLDSLEDRKADILRRYFGGVHMTAMASEYGISRERVRQLKDQAIAEAREKLSKIGLC